MRWDRTPSTDTVAFRNLKHNRHLCPNLQRQLEAVVNSYTKFAPIVYDMQGPNDDGVDVLVRVTRDGQEDEAIGWQVKSFNDFKKPDFYTTLKALARYYVPPKVQSKDSEH